MGGTGPAFDRQQLAGMMQARGDDLGSQLCVVDWRSM
jgi:hypothetical protein